MAVQNFSLKLIKLSILEAWNMLPFRKCVDYKITKINNK